MKRQTSLVFAIFLCGLASGSKSANSACSKFYGSFAKPRSCCHYPLPTVEKHVSDRCGKSCANATDRACHQECIIKEIRLFDEDNRLSVENSMEMFIGQYSPHDSLRSRWKSVVKESLEKCQTLVESKKSAIVMSHQVYFNAIVSECVLKENFINCPEPIVSQQCSELKNFLINCMMCCSTLSDSPLWTFWQISDRK